MRSQDIAVLFTAPGQQNYTLFSSPSRANFWGATASFSLIKSVEARFTQCSAGALAFLSFSTDGVFLQAPEPERRMEIIGDSISAGDLVYCEDAMGGHVGANNSLWADSHAVSYESRLCEAFGAECSTLAWGGMGLLGNDVPGANQWPTMPDVYYSAVAWPVLQAGQGAPLQYPHNFSAWTPQGVLIALGTNDASFGRFSNASFCAAFEARYVQLVRNISSLYGGGTKFLLANSPMSQAMVPSVQRVLSTLAGLSIPAVALDLALPNNTQCSCGHPSAADHLSMALGARPVIEAFMGWS
jgi:lysophospholipase L1-like esterase